MAWSLILIIMIFLWVVSLCKLLYASRSSSKDSFLCTGEALGRKKNVLLIIAHPDDESMRDEARICHSFKYVSHLCGETPVQHKNDSTTSPGYTCSAALFFSPTINYLTSRGHNLHILSMSTGNADAKGNIRKEELYQACAVLKVPLQQVTILDHPDLKDGFGKIWSHNFVAKITEEQVITRGIDLIITFDNYGVSGHKNHRDVHHGIRKLLCETSQRNIEGWELTSTSILRKYSGPVDIWLSFLCTMGYPRGLVHCLLNEHPCKSFLAMAQHRSQWVWYRKLFVLFSSYSYVNMLRKINV